MNVQKKKKTWLFVIFWMYKNQWKKINFQTEMTVYNTSVENVIMKWSLPA